MITAFDRQKFSKMIRQKRMVELQVNLREVAQKVGVSTPTLSRCENQGMPDLLTAHKVCEWLGVTVDSLLIKRK